MQSLCPNVMLCLRLQVFPPCFLPHPNAVGAGFAGGGSCCHGALTGRVVGHGLGTGQVSCARSGRVAMSQTKGIPALSPPSAAVSRLCAAAATSGRTSPSMTASSRSTPPGLRPRQ